MIKETYITLAKQFSLPDYEKLNSDFEISTLESADFLLRDIRRKITEKLAFYIKIIEDLMQPDTSFSCLHECRALSEEEKENIFNIYSDLMIIDRESNILSVEENSDLDSRFIIQSFNKWQELKPKLKSLLKKIKKTWQEKTEPGEKVRYFG